jgi:hypothetical protein
MQLDHDLHLMRERRSNLLAKSPHTTASQECTRYPPHFTPLMREEWCQALSHIILPIRATAVLYRPAVLGPAAL